MTVLNLPLVKGGRGPTSAPWRKLNNTQAFESPLTRSVQTLALPGARWACTASWVNLDAADAARMRAFLYALRGRAGRFYFGHPIVRRPRGTAGGTPLVAGAAQAGATLATDGWAAGATLLAGDFIGFGASELRMVVADSTADGAGLMSIVLDEPMRASPADNSALVLVEPKCIMRLTSDDVESLFRPATAGPMTDVTLDCVESW